MSQKWGTYKLQTPHEYHQQYYSNPLIYARQKKKCLEDYYKRNEKKPTKKEGYKNILDCFNKKNV